MKLNVIKETSSYLLVWKDANLPTTPTTENRECLITKIVTQRPSLRQIKGYKPEEYGLLNRLDTRTSGLVLIAKTQSAFDNLHEQLKNEEFTKIYLAYSYNLGSKNKGIIDTPIAHHPTKNTRMVLVKEGIRYRGKAQTCRTHFEKISLERAKDRWYYYLGTQIPFPSLSIDNKRFSWILCCITKGKRHQIRLHLKSIGYPIIGDNLYKPSSKIKHFDLPYYALYAIGLQYKKNKNVLTF